MDMAFCNGVLVYVEEEPEKRALLVSELIRVLKPGAHAVLMIREDDIEGWMPHLYPEPDGVKGSLLSVHMTTPRNNFVNKAQGEEIMYRQHVFTKLHGASHDLKQIVYTDYALYPFV